ncbi:MAG: hypothetical protein F4226_04790 [Synechococcus sp. SB0678_bin_12]|nr:hypothetical protein [Synechococcus sp. SB0678_bin_12]
MKRRVLLLVAKPKSLQHILLLVNFSLMFTILGGRSSSSGSEVDALPEISIETHTEMIVNIKQFFTMENIMQSFVNFCATTGGE